MRVDQFVAARLDEDERFAREAMVLADLAPVVVKASCPEVAAFVARHSAARVLREVQGQRAVLEEYRRLAHDEAVLRRKAIRGDYDIEIMRAKPFEVLPTDPRVLGLQVEAAGRALQLVVVLMAGAWADHPDYPSGDVAAALGRPR